MSVRTLEEIQRERGGMPHAFALMATGVLPDDPERAKAAASNIQAYVDEALSDVESMTPDMELTGLQIRMETADNYRLANLPNATRKRRIEPEDFECSRCGGGYLVETIGMFAGKRYIHTCGE